MKKILLLTFVIIGFSLSFAKSSIEKKVYEKELSTISFSPVNRGEPIGPKLLVGVNYCGEMVYFEVFSPSEIAAVADAYQRTHTTACGYYNQFGNFVPSSYFI